MPYKKKFYPKKSYQKKYYKRKYQPKPLSRGQAYGIGLNQLSKDVMMLKGLINVEFKTKDVTEDYDIISTPTLTLLNGLAKGDTWSSREGRSVRWKSLSCRLNISLDPAGATMVQSRVIFFIDKQPTGATPTAAQILQNTSNPINTPRNLDNRKRFVILRDIVVSQDQSTNNIIFRKYFTNLDMKTIYDGSDNGDITDISSNALYCMTLSDVATAGPNIRAYHRLRFLDN